MSHPLAASKVAGLSLSALVACLVIVASCRGSKTAPPAPPLVATEPAGGSGSGAAAPAVHYLPATKAGVLPPLPGSGSGSGAP
jgi:hypothetical protein